MAGTLKAYSFTFTKGAVGDPVKFSYPTYDGSGDPLEGAVLDSDLTVTARSATDGLTVFTVDGIGRPVLSLTATRAFPTVSDVDTGAVLPAPSLADAGKVATVNDAGTGYELDAPSGGGGGGASEPSVIGYADVRTTDDGDGPRYPLQDTSGNGSAYNTFDGSFVVGANAYTRVNYRGPDLQTATRGVTYASLFVFSADGTDSLYIWGDSGLDLSSDRLNWDAGNVTTEGSGITLDGVDLSKVKFTDAGVYHYRLVLSVAAAA